MEKDQQIFDLIDDEFDRQVAGIELIASENYVSDQVMEAMGSVMTNKYLNKPYFQVNRLVYIPF